MLLNWYLIGVEMNLGQAHKTKFWYLLGVFSKFSDDLLHHVYRGVPSRALLTILFRGVTQRGFIKTYTSTIVR